MSKINRWGQTSLKSSGQVSAAPSVTSKIHDLHPYEGKVVLDNGSAPEKISGYRSRKLLVLNTLPQADKGSEDVSISQTVV